MAVTLFQLDPSTHAPCTSSTLALRPLVPAGAASAAEARPEVCAAATPAIAAAPFNTVRRVGVPIGSSLTRSASRLLSNHAFLEYPKPSINPRQGRASTPRS